MKARHLVAAIVFGGVSLVVCTVGPVAAAPRGWRLQFRAVLGEVPSEASTPTSAPVDVAATRKVVASCDATAVGQLAFVPTTKATNARAGACVVLPGRPGGASSPRYYLGPAPDIRVASARPQFLAGQGWTVRVELTELGSANWDRLAEQQFHQQVAMVLDGVVQSAPTIQPDDQTFTSFDGTAVLSGSFTKASATAVAAAARR